MARTDFYTSLVLTAFGVGVVLESLRMPRLEERGVNPFTVPGLVPGVLGVVLALFGLIMLVRSWRQRATAGEATTTGAGDGGAVVTRLLLAITVTVGYGAVLVGWLPFTLATFVFVTGFIVLFEMRAPNRRHGVARIASVALVEGVLVAFAVTLVFERIFLVRLP